MVSQRPLDLSAIEEAILIWQEGSIPWNSQVDVSAPRLDPDRVRAAYNIALAHHRLAGSSIRRNAVGRLQWVRDDSPDIGEIGVVECADDDDLDRLRMEQLDAPLAMDAAPLVRTVIARRPGDDVLVSCVSHVMCDGMSVFRLARSVGRAYRGAHDPSPPVDIPTAHRVLSPAPPRSLPDLARRWATRLELAGAVMTDRARLAPDGGSDSSGFGLVVRRVPAADIAAARRRRGGSFDAYAMAALHVAVERWNRDHGAACDRVGISQGVNLRPDEWSDDVVVNLAAFASVVTDATTAPVSTRRSRRWPHNSNATYASNRRVRSPPRHGRSGWCRRRCGAPRSPQRLPTSSTRASSRTWA